MELEEGLDGLGGDANRFDSRTRFPSLLSFFFFLQINKRGDTVDEKIKKLDAELVKYKEQIKRTRPGPAQEAVKARAMRLLKQKKMYV